MISAKRPQVCATFSKVVVNSAESDGAPDSALLLACFEQAHQLSNARAAYFWASCSTLNPAEIALAVERCQRLEEGSGLWLAFERGKQIGRKRIGLRPFWC